MLIKKNFLFENFVIEVYLVPSENKTEYLNAHHVFISFMRIIFHIETFLSDLKSPSNSLAKFLSDYESAMKVNENERPVKEQRWKKSMGEVKYFIGN